MTTNDPQAGYVAEQRELLSDKLIDDFIAGTAADKSSARVGVIWALRQVAAMITSGELMVRKTVSLGVNRNRYGGFECPECHSEYPVGCDPFAIGVGEHCCCGARIIE